jgi:hypothetical protein
MFYKIFTPPPPPEESWQSPWLVVEDDMYSD